RRDPPQAVRARGSTLHGANPRRGSYPPVSATTARSPLEFEDAYEAYYAEAAEEVRAVRVGEKDTSEQAAIVARHADLFTLHQLEALRAAEAAAADGDEQERLYRLRRSCESGIVEAEIAARADGLENAII